MTTLPKRGQVYWLDRTVGDKRYRVSLGTRDSKAAARLTNKILFALADGKNSEVWGQLKPVLPSRSFAVLTEDYRFEDNITAKLEARFEDYLTRRVALGDLAESTKQSYFRASRAFFDRLKKLKIDKVDQITPTVVESYLVWRKESAENKGGNGRGVLTDRSVLSILFEYAKEEGLVSLSPVRGKMKITNETKGAEPFSPEEMDRLDKAVSANERLAFLLLRHTGMRCSDVVAVTWGSINWTDKTLVWKTKKRGKTVTIPLVEELYSALKWFNTEEYPPENEIILIGVSQSQLSRMCKSWGKLAGVENVTPHRFRDSRAVSILAGGGSIYDVARILGISVAVADAYYTSFTPQLQERVRGIMEGR